MNSLPQNPDTRDTLPESDASTWPGWTDSFRLELGPEPVRLCPLCGEPAEPSDLERFGCCMWCRAGSDAEPGPYRYTLSEFERVAAIAARPHVD